MLRKHSRIVSGLALAGIIPASFLLAHFGAGMAGGDAKQAMLAALGLGGNSLCNARSSARRVRAARTTSAMKP